MGLQVTQGAWAGAVCCPLPGHQAETRGPLGGAGFTPPIQLSPPDPLCQPPRVSVPPFGPALRFLPIFPRGTILPARRHLVSRFGSQTNIVQRLTNLLRLESPSKPCISLFNQSAVLRVPVCHWTRETSLVSRMLPSFKLAPLFLLRVSVFAFVFPEVGWGVGSSVVGGENRRAKKTNQELVPVQAPPQPYKLSDIQMQGHLRFLFLV